MTELKKILYASATVSGECFRRLFENSPAMPGQQASRYHRLLMKGLVGNGVPLYCLSVPPVTGKNTRRKIVFPKNDTEDGVAYHYIRVFNFRFIRNAFVMLSAFFRGLFRLDRDTVAVCDVLNVSLSLGITAAAKCRGSRIVGIVTDVPELMVTGHSRKLMVYSHKIIDKCDRYVFLTDAMSERLNPTGKPYTVIEGICDTEPPAEKRPESGGKKKCLYAGYLDAAYGVRDLTEGFLLAALPDTELHICGRGPYERELTEIAGKHPSVVFHGSLLNREVLALERECDLLINPRPTGEEFTRFSFPSKVMEYMSSGTPVLTTRLAGIPEVYFRHLFVIRQESAEGIRDALAAAFSLPEKERRSFGTAAAEWVRSSASCCLQAKKLMALSEDQDEML